MNEKGHSSGGELDIYRTLQVYIECLVCVYIKYNSCNVYFSTEITIDSEQFNFIKQNFEWHNLNNNNGVFQLI